MNIGKRIKNYRLMMGLTQEELANRSDVTKGFISQLEHDSTSPSVDTLESIVTALGLTLEEFFKESHPQKVVFSIWDAKYTVNEELKYEMYWIIPTAQKYSMEPVILELFEGGRSEEYPPFEGDSFGYVLEGEICLVFSGEESLVKEGEAFYFEAKKSFSIRNAKEKSKVLWLVSPPTF